MYAIVDIETTGGNAQYGGITEIAIVLHNGEKVEARFESLINPLLKIPAYITTLTGITNKMLENAPLFSDIAPEIYKLLEGKIFVAHNVNFDYSFVHHHLQAAGFNWQAKKLCTVKYARKVLPDKKSYSLGNICRELDIEIENRHRAGGDADATAQLLNKLMQYDNGLNELQLLVKGRNPNTYLPMHVPDDVINNLPYCPGVYYFHDKAGKVIYVGKARIIKYRVRSHFTNNNTSQRKQEFIRDICHISYQTCATDLMAIVLEALEIKKLWPRFNRSQKRFEQLYCLYEYEDQVGIIRLAVEKKRSHLPSLHSFHKIEEGFSIGRKLISKFALEEKMVFATAHAGIYNSQLIAAHNSKMQLAIEYIKTGLPTFGIVQQAEDEEGQKRQIGYLIENGGFYGMGYVDETSKSSSQLFKNAMTAYHDYAFVRATLHQYASNCPKEVINWS